METEGKCVGVVDGKVVFASKSLDEVVKFMRENYPDMANDPTAYITSVPLADTVKVV